MRDEAERGALPGPAERIRLQRKGRGGIFVLMTVCVLLAAGIATAGLWMREGAKLPSPTPLATQAKPTPTEPSDPPTEKKGIPIVSMDLSRTDLGEYYLHNQTPYRPDIQALTEEKISFLPKGGKVLILHSHATEGYLTRETERMEGDPGDMTYSIDPTETVWAVGEELCRVLNEKGITAIHCEVTQNGTALAGSYERAAEAVQRMMDEDPQIALVIDLHRDAVLTEEGAYVRTLTPNREASTAQLLPVVGTDCNGTYHPTWERNLALALQLRQALNQRAGGICRPVSLRTASYNQELAPAWLLLEVGSGANTVEEAKRATLLLGECLADILMTQP